MTPPRTASGFTLIEVMIAVAIVGILSAIAMPMYRNYIIRAKLVEGINALTTMRAQMEQYYLDNRTYATVSATIVTPCVAYAIGTATKSNSFTIGCSTPPTATAYTLVASGTGPAAGAVYTVDQSNNMVTSSFPTSWGSVPASNGCWLTRKGDSC